MNNTPHWEQRRRDRTDRTPTARDVEEVDLDRLLDTPLRNPCTRAIVGAVMLASAWFVIGLVAAALYGDNPVGSVLLCAIGAAMSTLCWLAATVLWAVGLLVAEVRRQAADVP